VGNLKGYSVVYKVSKAITDWQQQFTFSRREIHFTELRARDVAPSKSIWAWSRLSTVSGSGSLGCDGWRVGDAGRVDCDVSRQNFISARSLAGKGVLREIRATVPRK
jgi:hypothetical protein